MKTESPWRRRLKSLALAGAATAALTLGVGSAGAQAPPPGGPPPGGPPPGGGLFNPFPAPPMSPVDKLVTGLPPPMPGALIPMAAVRADAPMPSADPRDLGGTWHHNQALEFRMQRDMYGVLAPYNMAGAKVLERRVNSL